MFTANSYDEVVAALLDGGVGVIPTDTVYGLVARANDKAAVRRLYALKSRERKPGPIIAANLVQLEGMGIPAERLSVAKRFWPGPVSVILQHSQAHLHQGLGDQPFRIPADEALRAFLEQTGPLVTTSANQPGQPPARTLDEAQHYFGDRLDFYVDGGALPERAPSTIIRFASDRRLEVVRQGAADVSALLAK